MSGQLEIIYKTRFNKDILLMQKRGKNMAKLEQVLGLLVNRMELPKKYKNHKLKGYADVWECHIDPDWLLIYSIDGDELQLIRTGSHSDLF